MKKVQSTIAFLLLTFLSISLNAQNQCYVHLDKSFYVTGEIVWYKLYLPSSMSGQNAVVKSTLVSASGQNVINHFNNTKGETSISGYFKLPFDINSGVYSLVFSSTRGKAFGEEIFAEVFIPIYNDLTTSSQQQVTTTNVSLDYNDAIVDSGLSISIDLDKDLYACRDQVKASVQVLDQSGNPVEADVSVSVIDTELYASDISQPALFPGQELAANTTNFTDKIYYKGAYARGENNKLLPNEIIGAYSSTENKLFFSVPDPSTGNFHIELAPFQNSKPLQFIPHVEGEGNLSIELTKVGSPNNKQLEYSQAVLDYLQLSKQRKKLFQRYSTLESNLIPEEVDVEFNEFKHDKTFTITEYKSFENLASFVKEVSTPLRMRLKDDKYIGDMYIPSDKSSFSRYAEYPPLYIVNGLITRNSDFIARLDMSNILELSMMYEPKNIRKEYKIFGTNGLINLRINAKEVVIPEEDRNNVFSVSGYQPDTPYPEFMPTEYDNHQPFFRPQLYWNSDLSTNANGNLEFGFFQSDDVSTFIIEVVAKTADGKVATAQKSYKSVWQ